MPFPSLNVRTFDPELVVATFGSTPIQGIAEGTFISVEFEDGFEKIRGADGGVDRVNKNVADARITVTLKQTSPVNDILSTAHTLDRTLNTGKAPFTIKDLNGTTLCSFPFSWIVKYPNMDEADSISNREWVFDTGRGVINIGGNIL